MPTRTSVIEQIDVFSIRLPLKESFDISYGSFAFVESVLVKLTASDGTSGWGEATPDPQVTGETWAGAESVVRDVLAPLIIGADARNLPALRAAMDARIAGAPAARAACDIAIHDLNARFHDVPLWLLLGGRARERLTISRVISLGTPENMAANAMNHIRAGFSTIKLKVGDPDNIGRDVERILTVREAVGPNIGIKVDVNQGWRQPSQAIQAINASRRATPLYYEQPVLARDVGGMCEVKDATHAPLMIDEGCHGPRDALDVVSRKAADMINIKLMKSGGSGPAVEMAAIASAAGITCQIGTMVESSIASAAGLHVALSQSIIEFVEMGGPIMLAEDIGSVANWYQGETVMVPDLPGLGFVPDEARIRALSSRTCRIDL